MSNNVIAIFDNNNNTKCVVLAPLACHISGMDFNLFTMHMTYEHRINSHCVVHFLKFHMIENENMCSIQNTNQNCYDSGIKHIKTVDLTQNYLQK